MLKTPLHYEEKRSTLVGRHIHWLCPQVSVGQTLPHVNECNIELNHPNGTWMDEIVFGDSAGSVVASKGFVYKGEGVVKRNE
jgi:hypothetical protein